MAGYDIRELMAAKVILRGITRRKVPNTTLSSIMGWGLADRSPPVFDADAETNIPVANTVDYPTRTGTYDVIDETAKVAEASVPGAASTPIAPQKIGVVNFTLPRSKEVLPLGFERLNQLRAFGQDVNAVDSQGFRYIQTQQNYVAKRFSNLLEFQTAAMMRGSYYFTQEGDQLLQSFTGGEIKVDFQVPGSNLNKLAMETDGDIIDFSWDAAGTDIPGQLFKINAAFVAMTGRGLRHAIMNNVTYQSLINNAAIHAQGGTANVVFSSISQEGPGNFTVQLRSMPWLIIHIVDYQFDLWNGTAYASTKLIADNQAVFMPDVDSDWAQYINGYESIVEGPNGVERNEYGFFTYAYPEHNPAAWMMNAGMNGMPGLYNPKCIAYGSVIY